MSKGRPPIDREMQAWRARLAVVNAGLLACYETIAEGNRQKAELEAKIAAHTNGPTKFKGVTQYLGAPPGWDHDGDLGECMPLPIMRDENGLTSMWLPDSDELAALNAGAAVQLTIMAPVHPVVSVQVGALPDKEGL